MVPNRIVHKNLIIVYLHNVHIYHESYSKNNVLMYLTIIPIVSSESSCISKRVSTTDNISIRPRNGFPAQNRAQCLR